MNVRWRKGEGSGEFSSKHTFWMTPFGGYLVITLMKTPILNSGRAPIDRIVYRINFYWMAMTSYGIDFDLLFNCLLYTQNTQISVKICRNFRFQKYFPSNYLPFSLSLFFLRNRSKAFLAFLSFGSFYIL